MAEYIDREKLLNRVPKPKDNDERISRNGAMADTLMLVLDAPAEDVAPVVHGRWIQSKELPNYARCTACNKLTRVNGVDRTGNAHVHKAVYKYCCYCGAKMDLEGEDENET